MEDNLPARPIFVACGCRNEYAELHMRDIKLLDITARDAGISTASAQTWGKIGEGEGAGMASILLNK